MHILRIFLDFVIVIRNKCHIQQKELKILSPHNHYNSWGLSQLLNLSQELLSTSKQWWQAVIDSILESKLTETVAVFSITPTCTQVLAASKTGKLDFGEQEKRIGEPYLRNSSEWVLNLYLDGSYLLHIQKLSPFSQSELDFLHILRNMLLLHKSNVLSEEVVNKPIPVDRKNLRFEYPGIIGTSTSLLKVLGMIDKIVDTEVPVLIEGESGTGKELVAQAIHKYSQRSKFPFISENCSAIPETLLESELFGHVRGAFTGACQNKKGLFDLAHKGTLFLDEVGDMSLMMQKKLLRALQNGEIRPVGGKSIKKVDVRVISATNKTLKDAVSEGAFREDLYYRLHVVYLEMPPLRERNQDVLLIFDHFLTTISQQMQIECPQIDEQAKACLLNYQWPGNVRELRNEVQRILALLEGDLITCEILSPEISRAK